MPTIYSEGYSAIWEMWVQLYFVPLALMIAPPSNACIKILLRTYIVKFE